MIHVQDGRITRIRPAPGATTGGLYSLGSGREPRPAVTASNSMPSLARALEHDGPGVLRRLACDRLRNERIVRPSVDILSR